MDEKQRQEEDPRFQAELEFVQCLANPDYCRYLAQKGYFEKDEFVNYLKYLMYWKKPEYAKYLEFPQCLYMLQELQKQQVRDGFRDSPGLVNMVRVQMMNHHLMGSYIGREETQRPEKTSDGS
eukprot:g4122.t1